MPTGRWRCFVAAPMPDDLRQALADARRSWMTRPDLAPMRWTEPAGWHLTLGFIGSVEAERIGSLRGLVRALARRHATMRLATGGLGAFPSPARARVAWYGVADEPALVALADDLAASLDLERAGPFRAHVTLGRPRSGPLDLRQWLADDGPAAPHGTWAVERIALMRSHLGRGPARYETLEEMDLGGKS